MAKILNISKPVWRLALVSFVAGALLILAIRLSLYKPEEHPHYHANFAVYINGQREEFKDPFYYVEVGEACAEERQVTAYERAHLHDNVNDVVHVEDRAVTWGHFFQNIGWVVDPKLIKTTNQTFVADENNKVTFMVNRQKVKNIVNEIIGDKDRVLVDFGNSSDEQLKREFDSIAATAEKYNVTPDPESCSGSKQATFKERLKHLFK